MVGDADNRRQGRCDRNPTTHGGWLLNAQSSRRTPTRRTSASSTSGCATPGSRRPIDTTTPMGKLVFQVTGAFAEFERTMIRQRIKAGLKRAVAQGVKLGRPKIDSTT